jgi:hypothetical protein
MVTEQKFRQIPSSEGFRQNERLKPGQKLLLSSIDYLTSFTFLDKKFNEDGSISLSAKEKIDDKLLESIFKEYFSIYGLLAGLVGKENITVVKNELKLSVDPKTGKDIPVNLPDDLGAKKLPFLTEFFHTWIRDAHTLLNGKIFTNPNAWTQKDANTIMSGLGEGGKVLTRSKSILVTPDIYETSKADIKNLSSSGFKIGYLPFVDKSKQKNLFHEEHVDGHATLVEYVGGRLALVVASSYISQGEGAKKQIKKAADKIGAKLFEVDDRILPPLAFNLLQFEDRSIAMTSGAKTLETILASIVGKDKIFTTKYPIENIPKLHWGGIRCLTNIILSYYVDLLNLNSNIPVLKSI